jgi:hypothetical protein
MPVIINEFEILSEGPEPARSPDRSQNAAGPPAMRPQDIEQIVRHFEERRARLVAD